MFPVNVPNVLTVLRILAVPVLVVALLDETPDGDVIAAIVFALAALTDGLELRDAYVTAIVRCAPPANKPTPSERDECLPWLDAELQLLERARVFLALGAFAWDGILRALRALGHPPPAPKPRFGHGAEAEVGPYRLLGSYHPSQQNTFTGKLTLEMIDAVMARARELTAG